MKTTIGSLLKFSVFFSMWISVQATPSYGEAMRVLFVGNSYTYADDIPWITMQLAASAKKGKTIEVEMVAPLGATLESHWKQGNVARRLLQAKWHFVVLQEQSTRPTEDPENFKRYAHLLDREIKKAGAKTVLFATWPRREHPDQLDKLTNAYMSVGKELNALVAPVGIAWQHALNEKPSLNLYHEDGSHPGPAGSYLAACVFYSLVSEKSPIGLPGTLYTVRRDGSHVRVGELSKADASLIQRAAWKSVQTLAE